MSAPWIRNIEVKIGPFSPGPSPGREGDNFALRVFSDGTTGTLRTRFRLQKHRSGTPFPGVVEIYNLSEDTRTMLRQPDVGITVNAGWASDGEELGELYSGQIWGAYSHREGADIITSLVCLSHAKVLATTFSEPRVDTSDWWLPPGSSLGPGELPSGIPESGAIMQLASWFKGVVVSENNIKVSAAKKISARGYTAQGLISDCLNELARAYGFSWAIHDGVFYASDDVVTSQALGVNVLNINSKNGTLLRIEPLLASGFQRKYGAVIHTFLNPIIRPGDVLAVESDVNPSLSAAYRAQAVTHVGDSHGPQWETIAETQWVSADYQVGQG